MELFLSRSVTPAGSAEPPDQSLPRTHKEPTRNLPIPTGRSFQRRDDLTAFYWVSMETAGANKPLPGFQIFLVLDEISVPEGTSGNVGGHVCGETCLLI